MLINGRGPWQVEAARELSQRLVDFLADAGGQADSSALIGHFAPRLSAVQAPLFRQLLQQVAKLRTAPGISGKAWVLRPDFVPDR